MSLNLNIPITQTLTLPDNWQACKTPQELSYWIIAKFDNFTTQFTEINNAMSALQSMIETNTGNIATNDAEIAEIKTSIANINTTLGEINTSIETLNNDYGTLHSNYMAMNNRLAIVEDDAGYIPTIKNDITNLKTSNSNLTGKLQNFNGQLIELNEEMSAISRSIAYVTKFINISEGDSVIDLNSYLGYYNLKINILLPAAVTQRPIIRVPTNDSWSPGDFIIFDIFYKSEGDVGFGTINASSEYAQEDIYTKLGTTPMGSPVNSYNITELSGLTGRLCGVTIRIVGFKKDAMTDPQYYWCIL